MLSTCTSFIVLRCLGKLLKGVAVDLLVSPHLQAALTMNGWLEKRGGQDASKVTQTYHDFEALIFLALKFFSIKLQLCQGSFPVPTRTCINVKCKGQNHQGA